MGVDDDARENKREHAVPLVLPEYLSEKGAKLLSSERLRQLVSAPAERVEEAKPAETGRPKRTRSSNKGRKPPKKKRDPIAELERQLRQQLRTEWMNGRSLFEMARYGFHLERQAVSRGRLARELLLSTAALSNWFQGHKGIDAAHLEIARRIFDQVFNIPQQSFTRFELDFVGYRRAITFQKMFPKGIFAEEYLTEVDFWRLWFLLRNRQWLRGQREQVAQYKELAASQIGRRVQRVLSRLDPACDEGWLAAVRAETRVAHLQQLIENWGAAFALTMAYLDRICWTSPDA